MVTSLDPERAARRRGARHGPTRSVRDCARRRCLLGASLPRKDRLYAIALDLLQSREKATPVRSTVRGWKTASLPETLTLGVHVRSGGTRSRTAGYSRSARSDSPTTKSPAGANRAGTQSHTAVARRGSRRIRVAP